MLAEKWIEKIVEVVRVSDRIMYVKLMVGEELVTFICVYTLQANLTSHAKQTFL